MGGRRWLTALAVVALAAACSDTSGSRAATTSGRRPEVSGTGGGAPTGGGDEALETVRRHPDPFTRVSLASSADVTIRQASPPSVAVTAAADVVDRVTTEARGGTLVIGARGAYATRHPVRVDVVTSTVDAVSISGSGTIRATGIRGARLRVSVTGSGDVGVTGSVEDLEVDLAGSGDVNLGDLAARRAAVTVGGAGDVEVRVSESLRATVSGAGDVVYAGDPRDVRTEVTGSGSIRRRPGTAALW